MCEALDALAAGLGERGGPTRAQAAQALRAATTEVYEACGFQDITGQRISKVVGALQAIDRKVARILAAFGDRRTDATGHPGRLAELSADLSPDRRPDLPADLLAGPQLPELAMDQGDIDRLLEGL